MTHHTRRVALKEILTWPRLTLDPRFVPGAIAAQGGCLYGRPLKINGQDMIPYAGYFSPAYRPELFSSETRRSLVIAMLRAALKESLAKARGSSPSVKPDSQDASSVGQS